MNKLNNYQDVLHLFKKNNGCVIELRANLDKSNAEILGTMCKLNDVYDYWSLDSGTVFTTIFNSFTETGCIERGLIS